MNSAPVTAAELDVDRVGQGPPVLFVHGSIVGADLTWRQQRPLSEHWELPWEADIPLAALAAGEFPALVISGGHSPVFEAVCDALVEPLGAERAVIEGKSHSIPETGAPYNERLHRFLVAAVAPGAATPDSRL